MILSIKVGDVITFKEPERYLGYGDLTLRITELPPGHLPDGSDWVQVTGVEIAGDGEEIGERTALVRTAALRPPP
ncbi:hypothetical protein [Virgisporangium aurantiacum]|uniref:Uncharacterized protein n=1 Tax=Virgisporangium aurantiacum TaxID=175570 RepID=A0A8J3ZG96_9ACTN|nr:hypothetical protein [Virgisporangium aurantiacum]GIJ63374.1 hypothetical protein Vau01_108900 [Virgisporangium aurantiacum]